MGLRSFLGDHPYAAAVSTLLILVAAVVLVAPGFFQATLTPSTSDCGWTTVDSPDTGEQYTSLSAYYTDFQSAFDLSDTQLESYKGNVETRFTDSDGDGDKELQVKNKECISRTYSGEVQ